MTGVENEVALWWRDDDAGKYSENLEWILELAASMRVPLGLAVVPAWLDSATVSRVLAVPEVSVLQHGWAHANHALLGEKSVELGGAVDSQTCCVELEQGRLALATAFGERFLPVMVPPWNRIDSRVMRTLPALGYSAISTFAGDRRGLDHHLAHVNTHIDLIDWRTGRRMKSLDAIDAEIMTLLNERHAKLVGILTHHLDMTADDMTRLARLFKYMDGLPNCHWTSPMQLFPSP